MKNTISISKVVKQELANFLGVSVEDINDDDSLTSDLHLGPHEVTDFLELLQTKGLDTSKTDLASIDTLSDLVDTFEYAPSTQQ